MWVLNRGQVYEPNPTAAAITCARARVTGHRTNGVFGPDVWPGSNRMTDRRMNGRTLNWLHRLIGHKKHIGKKPPKNHPHNASRAKRRGPRYSNRLDVFRSATRVQGQRAFRSLHRLTVSIEHRLEVFKRYCSPYPPPPVSSITPGEDYIFSKLVWNMINRLVEWAGGGGESTRIRFFHLNYCREIHFFFFLTTIAESRDFSPKQICFDNSAQICFRGNPDSCSNKNAKSKFHKNVKHTVWLKFKEWLIIIFITIN